MTSIKAFKIPDCKAGFFVHIVFFMVLGRGGSLPFFRYQKSDVGLYTGIQAGTRPVPTKKGAILIIRQLTKSPEFEGIERY